LESRGVSADLIVVADHGMAAVSAERVIILEDLLPADAGRALALGAFMTYAASPGKEALVDAALLAPHPRMRCWRKSEIPRRYHYGANRRAPPIFCLPKTGWEISSRAGARRRPAIGGNHGFDPYDRDMRAVFVANGPDIARGVRLPVFDNVDVYPLLTRLVGVEAEPSDGTLRSVGRALAIGWGKASVP
jgi:predicted AlkP superfamily pyrophosphatase or phosphodiesterase